MNSNTSNGIIMVEDFLYLFEEKVTKARNKRKKKRLPGFSFHNTIGIILRNEIKQRSNFLMDNEVKEKVKDNSGFNFFLP